MFILLLQLLHDLRCSYRINARWIAQPATNSRLTFNYDSVTDSHEAQQQHYYYYVDLSCRQEMNSLPSSMACTSIFAYCMIKIAVPTSIPSQSCRSFKLTKSDVSWVTRTNPLFFSKAPNGAKAMPSWFC